MGKIPFRPRSQGFYAQQFTVQNFGSAVVCDAVKCIRDLIFTGEPARSFIDEVIELLELEDDICPEIDGECPSDENLEDCATLVRERLLDSNGALMTIDTVCPGLSSNERLLLRNLLIQYVANLLNVCIADTIPNFGFIGGVSLEYQVELTDVEKALLGFGVEDCVTVDDILNLGNEMLLACGTVPGVNLSILQDVLSRMAQDFDQTIIIPQTC